MQSFADIIIFLLVQVMGCGVIQPPPDTLYLDAKKNPQIELLESQIKEFLQTKSKNQKQIARLKVDKQQLNAKLQQADLQQFELVRQITLSNQETELAKKKQDQLKSSFQIQSAQIKKKYQAQLADLRKNLSQLEKSEKQSKQLLNHQSRQKTLMKKKIVQLQQRIKLSEKKNQETIEVFNKIKINYLFQGQILENNYQSKKLLVQTLQQETHKKIVQTKQIYRYDPYNSTNFHTYIDNKKNLVLVIKAATSKHVFGGWTESSFSREQISNGQGLLFSLTSKKSYKLIAGKKAISYDQEFIIFGNSQIRLKSSQKKVTSKFGLINFHYKHENDSRDIFIGSMSQSIDIEGYEIYQLVFKTD